MKTKTKAAASAQTELMTVGDVMTLLQVSRRTVYRLRSDRGFPAPVVLAAKRNPRWRRTDVNAWLDQLRAA